MGRGTAERRTAMGKKRAKLSDRRKRRGQVFRRQRGGRREKEEETVSTT